MTKPTIIFDFDGTIADTFPVVLKIFHEVSDRQVALSSEEAKLLRRVALRQVKGKAMLHHAAALRVRWWHVPFLFFACREILKGRMQEVQPMPGMVHIIKQLHEAGYTMVVISSNGAKNINTFLKKEHLRAYISAVYGSVRSGRKAAVLQRLQEHAPHLFSEAWLVSDEGRDIEAARLAHVQSAAVLWGYNERGQLEAEKPSAIAETPEQLLELLMGKHA